MGSVHKLGMMQIHYVTASFTSKVASRGQKQTASIHLPFIWRVCPKVAQNPPFVSSELRILLAFEVLWR